MFRNLALAAAIVLPIAATGATADRQPSAVLADLGLTKAEIADVDAGRPVAKVLSWGNASEIFVFGAVHINGTADGFLAATRDVGSRSGNDYLAREIPPRATAADLGELRLEADDVKALEECKEGDCDVQLPTASIQAFRSQVTWDAPDAADQVNRLARGMAVRLLAAYQQGGNPALGVYRDKKHPALVAEQFKTMVSRASALPDVLPELRQYLLDYPNATLPAADSFFYWERVSFGLKPTIRLNHAVVYRTRAGDRDAAVVAIKQLSASHYFHTALDVSVCLADAAPGAARGYYLLTLKASEQEGLTGFKGSILRKVVVDKTRSSLETALAAIKRAAEQ